MEFLSEEWVREVGVALAGNEEITDFAAWADLTIQHVVSDVPGRGTVEYWRRFADGEVTVELGRDPAPETTLTSSYEVACALNAGELDVQSAFAQGKLQAEGSVAKLMQHASELRDVSETQNSVAAEYAR